MYKLIAADMDETLLGRDGRPSPRTKRALKRCMEAGAYFSLSSGRMPEAMREIAEEIGVNAPLIMFNGGMIHDLSTGETLFKQGLPAKTANEILKMAEDMHLYIQAYPGVGYFCNEHTPLTYMYEKRIRVKAQDVHMPLSNGTRRTR